MAMLGGSELGGPPTGYDASASRRIGTVLRADVFAADLVWVQFGQPMVRDAALLAAATYTMTGDNATTLPVREVLTGDSADSFVSEVWLATGGIVHGAEYTVAVIGAVRATTGSVLASSFKTARFIGRRTAMDGIMASLPAAFRVQPGSRIRGLVNAVGRQIDLAAGSRLDLLP